MATVGEVTAVLRARTEQFTAPVAKASASLNALRGEFAQTRTQLNHAQTRLAQVAVQNTAVATSAVKARQGIGTMRSALGSLTARLIGVNGTMGTFAGAIGQFAVGNAVTLGIIAGIGGIALAYRKLTERTRELAATTDEAFKRLQSQWKITKDLTRATIEYEMALAQATLQSRIAEVEAFRQAGRPGRLQGALQGARRGGLFPGAGLIGGFLTAPFDEKEAQERIIALQQAIAGMQQRLRGLDETAKGTASSMRELSVASEQFGETMRRAGEEVLAKVGIGIMRSVRTEAEIYAEKVKDLTLRLQLGKITQEEFGETLRRLHAEFNQTAAAADRAAVNIQAIQFAVESLINRLIHGGGFSILGALSGAIFGFLQGGPAGAVLGGVGGGFGVPGLGNLPQAIPGLANLGAQGGAVATIKMEPSVNPYVVANNAEWQRAIAETNRALARGGHRIAVVPA